MTTAATETGVLAGEERMLIDGELQSTAGGGLPWLPLCSLSRGALRFLQGQLL